MSKHKNARGRFDLWPHRRRAALVCDTVRHYRDRSRKAVDRFAEIQTRNNREWLSTIRKLLGNAIAARGDY